MNLKSRVKKLTERAKRANKAYVFVAAKYQSTDIDNPKYGLLEASGDIKPFTHVYYGTDELTSDIVRELLHLNANDQIVIVDKSFTENCMSE